MDMDQRYLALLTERIDVCRAYQPRFGQGQAVSLADFQALYGGDSFYTWFGLNNPLVYAAHKAAGGITSLYRQIGIGCERLFQQIVQDQLALSAEQIMWSYRIQTPTGQERTLSLDACIRTALISPTQPQQVFQEWLMRASSAINVDVNVQNALRGSVFEVRQGYKSKDAKRQNADIGNAGTAYAQGFLPVLLIFSEQIDSEVAARYSHAGWVLLYGMLGDDPTRSAYAFCRNVLGYDLAAFFARNAHTLSATVAAVMQSLLAPTNETGNYNDDFTE